MNVPILLMLAACGGPGALDQPAAPPLDRIEPTTIQKMMRGSGHARTAEAPSTLAGQEDPAAGEGLPELDDEPVAEPAPASGETPAEGAPDDRPDPAAEPPADGTPSQDTVGEVAPGD